MFRRNNRNDVLPSTTYGTGGGGGGGLPSPFGGGGGNSFDGSGRSIKVGPIETSDSMVKSNQEKCHIEKITVMFRQKISLLAAIQYFVRKMDAPVVKAWKKASGYTKYTYYIIAVTLFMVIYGFRSLRYWNASIWLTCHLQECTLEITPPGTRTMTVIFPRSQLHNAHAIKTDKNGNFVAMDTLRDKPLDPRRKKKKNKGNPDWHNKGPDSQGRYGTYEVKFWKKSPVSDSKDNFDDADFAEVKDYLREIGDDMYGLSFRHFSLSQSRMRVRSNVNKVESYVKRRRQKLLIKESATLPWQAILCLVFGLVGTMLTCLIGQFWDDEPRRQGGPGARRSHQKSYRGNGSSRRNPSRPSSGSQYRKGY